MVHTGLSQAEVLESRQKYGENVITPPPKESALRAYLEKFSDPLIVILLMAGFFSLLISVYEFYWLQKSAQAFFEPVGIFVAIFLATGLGFIFERKANREFELLNQFTDEESVQVIRSGNPTTVPRREVVVGDIIVLSTGEEIPADAELLEASAMLVDESSLTGEPVCQKDIRDNDADATFPANHVLRGSKIMEGHGIAKVFAVGDATENGKVFKRAQIDDSVRTPLNEQLERLGRLITNASYAIAALVIAGRMAVYFMGNHPAPLVYAVAYGLQSVMLAITLIVVAVPEGLPMAVTLSLAYSMRRMLKTSNLARKMHACETMGAVTVICTDKTGTLTCNRMSVIDFYPPANASSSLTFLDMAINSTASLDFSRQDKPEPLGNPTEGALLIWLVKNGVNYSVLREDAKIEAEIPFSGQRKYMASQVALSDGSRYILVKGAPEIVLDLCAELPAGLTREDVNRRLAEWQSRAMRTLAFAARQITNDNDGIIGGELQTPGLQFLGVVAIADPVRHDVPDAIRECQDAGIEIKIVTGDTPGTAREIGRQIGLWKTGDDERNLLTGPELSALNDDDLDRRIDEIRIIARARPLDKERLVKSLQRKNHVVAVTGDGTNDAPALNAAHVGLSMGSGTSVAKEASDITILDNSFASISRAVMWGRSLYENIQRFILFQMTVNVAACLTVLAGAFMGSQSPLTVTQMLWVNLIMDTFAAMALASLPPRREVMLNNPRSREAFIITPPMWRRIVCIGGFFFIFLTIFAWYLQHHAVTNAADIFAAPVKTAPGLSPYECSMFFTTFVMLQFWNLFNAKAYATGESAMHLADCGGFLFIAAIILFGQILIVSLGRQFFNVSPMSLSDWLIIILATSPVLWLGEFWRLLSSKRSES